MDTIKVYVVRPDQSVSLVEIEPTLGVFQEWVGGYIEGISREGIFAYCDEEGRLNDKPFNPLASSILGTDMYGTVVFVGPVDDEGNETSVSDEFVQEMAEAMVL